MPRGGTGKQNQTFNTASTVGNNANATASNLQSTLTPMYTAEATNPQGFGSDLAGINTAAQQSSGGAVSAVKGAAGLAANRTGNRGAFQTTLDDTVRNAMRTNSQNALDVQGKNALLKQTQKQQGLAGLQGLYGTNVGELLSSMGIQEGVANNQASQPGWFQNMISLINAVKPGGSTANGGSLSFGG